jgi:hypothetical protein
MSWNITKCGVIGSQRDLLLNAEPLPHCESYKYLGVPHKQYAIDWKQLLLGNLAKAKNLLLYLLDYSAWPHYIKLGIYKVFVRPLFEYCMPLIAAWISQNNETQLFEEIEAIQRQAIRWVFNYRSETSNDHKMNLEENLLGIGTYSSRLLSLNTSFALSLKKLNTENPLLAFIGQYFPFSKFKNDSLMKSLKSTKWSKEFTNLEPKPSFKAFIRSKRLSLLDCQKLEMGKCISNSSRTRSLCDCSITIKQTEMRDAAIKWRLNRAFISRSCCCGNKFNRRRVNECALIDDILSPNETVTFHQFKTLKPGTNFNRMDFLLNTKNFISFYTAFKKLDNLLPK